MTSETKEAFTAWATDFIKTVGFPVAACAAMLWFGYVQMQALTDQQGKMSDWVREKFSVTLENNTSAMRAVESAVKESIEVNKESNDTRMEATKVIDRLDATVNRINHDKGAGS